jgi:hypothetical protein
MAYFLCSGETWHVKDPMVWVRPGHGRADTPSFLGDHHSLCKYHLPGFPSSNSLIHEDNPFSDMSDCRLIYLAIYTILRFDKKVPN